MRFLKMSWEERRTLPPADHFSNLPHPRGRGHMTIGHKAEEKLRWLTFGILTFNGLENTISRGAMRSLLGKALVQRFISEKRPIDRRQIDKLISFLGREANATRSPLIHLVPCHLMYAQEPDEIPIGPVILRTRHSFQKKILPAIAAYDKGPKKDWAKHMALAVHYYRAFKWVAEIPVTPADGEMSNRIAMEAAQAAINCLHVSLGAGATSKMIVGGPRMIHDRRAHLHFDASEKIHASLSMSGPGSVGFAEGWSKDIPGSEFRYFLDLFGIAMEVAVNPDLRRPLSRRLLDAIYWFGEAVRETTDAARIVKYVTALERMMMTQERNDIADVVSDRVAAFIWIDDRSKTLEEWKRVVSDLYDLRSRLVHGDMSPGSTDASENVHMAAHVTRMSILSALHHFGSAGIRAENAPKKVVARWFNNIVDTSQREAAGYYGAGAGTTATSP
jgi:hypothetical protein